MKETVWEALFQMKDMIKLINKQEPELYSILVWQCFYMGKRVNRASLELNVKGQYEFVFKVFQVK